MNIDQGFALVRPLALALPEWEIIMVARSRKNGSFESEAFAGPGEESKALSKGQVNRLRECFGQGAHKFSETDDGSGTSVPDLQDMEGEDEDINVEFVEVMMEEIEQDIEKAEGQKGGEYDDDDDDDDADNKQENKNPAPKPSDRVRVPQTPAAPMFLPSALQPRTPPKLRKKRKLRAQRRRQPDDVFPPSPPRTLDWHQSGRSSDDEPERQPNTQGPSMPLPVDDDGLFSSSKPFLPIHSGPTVATGWDDSDNDVRIHRSERKGHAEDVEMGDADEMEDDADNEEEDDDEEESEDDEDRCVEHASLGQPRQPLGFDTSTQLQDIAVHDSPPPVSLPDPPPPRSAGSTPPPVNDILVSTKLLKNNGLIFNRDHGLLICEPCGVGFPLNNMCTHLKISRLEPRKRIEWDEEEHEWSQKQVFLPHSDYSALSAKKRSFADEVVASLVEAGFITDRSEVRDAPEAATWRSDKGGYRDINQVHDQILGLRVFWDVPKCTYKKCNQIFTTQKTYKNHHSDTHGKVNRSVKMVTAQTLCEDNSFKRYFEVVPLPPTSKDVEMEAQSAAQSEKSAATLLREKKEATMGLLNVAPSRDARVILPVFVNTGIHAFLQQFNRKTIRQRFRPDKDDPLYQRLREIHRTSFLEDMNSLDKAPPSLLTQMTNRTNGVRSDFTRRSFAQLILESSGKVYAGMEARETYAYICALGWTMDDGKEFFTFTDKQKTALRTLLRELKRKTWNKDAATKALYDVFFAIYFPDKKYKLEESVFGSPVIAFLALECLTYDGEYRSIYLIPPTLAKIQYSMRLRAWHEFKIWYGFEVEDTETTLAKCVAFCDIHLADYSMSSFSTLRHWMHKFSVTAKSTPRAVVVWWREDTVTIGDNTVVNFSIYKSFLRNILKQTEELVEQQILFGMYSMHQIEEVFKISELRDLSPTEDVLGMGILVDGTSPTLDNPQSEIVINKMKAAGHLGLHVSQKGDLAFGQAQSLIWLGAIEAAMERVMALCHILQGPPGRMTEESLMPLTNTLELSRSVVFMSGEQTGAFRSGYHKGAYISGYHHHILRLLPYRVFALLYVLIRLIRPIELAVLLDFIIPGDKRQVTADAYRDRIFATRGRAWNATHMSQVLERFFRRGMGVQKMNASTYRHFSVAVMRHYPMMSDNAYKAEDLRLARIGDLMAGHTPRVAEMNYARTDNTITGIIDKVDCIRICKRWHALHEMKTGYEAEK